MLAETLLGAAGALLVLLFVFASFLAFLPLLIAAVSILTTFLLVLGLTTFSEVSFVVQFLISLIGLGVAIDYSLLLVSRWREERAHGRTNEEAVVVAMKTAGHAVLASGVTVAISLVALVVVPVPFLRSMGIGGMLIPLVSVAVVLTLLPALLSKVGPRIDYPRIRKEGVASKGWTAWARGIVSHKWLATGAALVILGLLIYPVSNLKIGTASVDSLARSGAPYDALGTLSDAGVGTGVLTPIVVLVDPDQADAAADAAREVDGIQLAAVVLGRRRTTAVIQVVPVEETVDSSSNEVVDDGPDHGRGGRRRRGPGDRRRRDRRGLLHRGLRQVPVRAGPDRADHLRPADADVPLDPAAHQGRGAQPGLAGRGLRRGRLLLAGGPRLRPDLQRVGHRRHHVLAARW